MTIIFNASTDGQQQASVEMPGEFKVTQDGTFLFWSKTKKKFIEPAQNLGPLAKERAFDAIMREQYRIEVK